MSTHLKLLALASAAMLTLPMAAQAAPSLDFVENNLGGWTFSATGFTTLTESPASAFTTSVATPFTAPATISFTGTWADSVDTANGSGSAFVIASATNSTVIGEFKGSTSFADSVGTFHGIIYLGSSAPNTASGPEVIAQGSVETFGFATGGSITIDTSAIPEPASLTLFGTGLMGLGALLRRRRKAADPTIPQANDLS
jgi:hypothetical protein